MATPYLAYKVTMTVKRKLLGFFAPMAAVMILTVLLIFALGRLAQIQQEMRTNVSANMLWVIAQAQTMGLRLNVVLQQAAKDPEQGGRVINAYKLLNSRLRLLSAGPQSRYLEELGDTEALMAGVRALGDRHGAVELAANGDLQATAGLLSGLESLDFELGRAANKTMVAQWEHTGARLDHYRDGVLTVIFLMIGICLCCLIISGSMFVAFKRARDSEWAKHQAQQLKNQLESERQITELHRNFGAMISHQFRTPLAIIDASMQRLVRTRGEVSEKQIARHVQKVRRATDRLTRLVDRTLIADEYAGPISVNLQPCDLRGLVQTLIEQQREIVPGRSIDLVRADDDIPRAWCDPLLVEHIVANLLSNAIKYSSAESTVAVRLFCENGRVGCAVHDQGIGMAPAILSRLYDRYYRAPDVASTQGTGMGLYVARKLAVLQGGWLNVYSVPGEGSVFRVCFPVAPVLPAQSRRAGDSGSRLDISEATQ